MLKSSNTFCRTAFIHVTHSQAFSNFLINTKVYSRKYNTRKDLMFIRISTVLNGASADYVCNNMADKINLVFVLYPFILQETVLAPCVTHFYNLFQSNRMLIDTSVDFYRRDKLPNTRFHQNVVTDIAWGFDIVSYPFSSYIS